MVLFRLIQTQLLEQVMVYTNSFCAWALDALDKIGATGNDNLYRNSIFFPYHDIDYKCGYWYK